MSSVCAIIPALNEEKTIASVVQSAMASSLVDEVIVVSDGSTDATVSIAKEAGAQVLEHDHPQGKAQAMETGVQATDASILLFLDADLVGLTAGHVDQLAGSVRSSACAMNIGLRDRGDVGTWMTRFLPHISGERALKREVWEYVPSELKKGFMIEVALNVAAKRMGARVCLVPLDGLTFRRKIQKVGLLRGGLGYVKMAAEIINAIVYAHRLIR